ncbi:lysine--tRNA ligase [Candidatus Woesebacteria bacterium]|nr:lysine--tRNA ligase [Candidatus Woesebacteria bacterium]
MAEKRLKEIRKIRLQRVEKFRELGIDPYPSKVDGNPKSIKKARDSEGKSVEIAGRLMGWRGHGNVSFADLKDESGQIQLWFQKNNLGESFKVLNYFDIGDFMFIKGNVVKTKAGELTVDVEKFQLLSKSVHPLPSTWYGLKDEESRYRQRYVDLILNDDLKDLFRKKAVFWQSMRDFMIEKGFLEVETPVLENTAGGADANPFVTHHDALDIDLYLRISMGELWQKRLMVAGFEKTFEIGRQFRNEGISREHLQDYTQMEFYWAYANYEDSMKLVEEMYKYVAEKTFGKMKFKIGDFDVDLEKSWERIDYTETIKSNTGVDISSAGEDEVKAKLKELGVKFEEKDSKGRLIDHLWKHVRKGVAGPAFLVGHPVEVSPLAKRQKDHPELVERYQVIVAGSEMGNGYSELNDPIDQSERFKKQQKMRDEGDEEAQMYDEDFVRALEYGMPPTTGFGVSERLFSFLTDLPIREAVLFPLLRPEIKEDEKGKEKYDYKGKKLVAVIDKNMSKGLAANALGHIAYSAGHYSDDSWMGQEKIEDSDGNVHKGISRYPFIVLGADTEKIQEIVENSKNENLLVVDYSNVMFDTGKDEELVKKLSKTKKTDIKYHAVLLAGETSLIDSITKGLNLYGKQG